MEDKEKMEAEARSSKGALRGHWVVDPSGHLVLLAVGGALKAGWRYATPADHQAAAAVEKARAEKEARDASEAAAAARLTQEQSEPQASGGPLK